VHCHEIGSWWVVQQVVVFTTIVEALPVCPSATEKLAMEHVKLAPRADDYEMPRSVSSNQRDF
jgi:hypothetical protein